MSILRSVVLLLIAAAPLPLLGDGNDQHLDIYWIDVEGGAATLVVTPTGESVLFDTGYARFAGRIHELLTETAKLERLDYLVTTHYDSDHYQGAVPLSRMIDVVHIVDNGRFPQMRRDPGAEYFQLQCQERIVINPGDAIGLQQSPAAAPISLRCLATRQEFMPAPPTAPRNDAICATATEKDPDPSENANSTVFVLQLGAFRFFDAGDLTWNLEAKLVCPVDLVGPVDVYQVTHHGLDMSNNPVVIQTIQPTIAVMNNGPKKGTQPETVHNLRTARSIQAIYQLHENERPDGRVTNTRKQLIANPAGVTGNYIKLSVDPDGSRYTVTIPFNGHQRSYKTTVKP